MLIAKHGKHSDKINFYLPIIVLQILSYVFEKLKWLKPITRKKNKTYSIRNRIKKETER